MHPNSLPEIPASFPTSLERNLRRCVAQSLCGETISMQTTSQADWYRGRAVACLASIEHTPSDSVKATLADTAATWFRLAELVHKWDGGDRGRASA
jgi:hypothetical protein